MTKMHSKHADQVVQRFRDMLSDSGRQHVGERHFDELSLLIESAIDTAILEEAEAWADQLEQMAHRMRHSAETFEVEA